MHYTNRRTCFPSFVILLSILLGQRPVVACSTFKLQKGNELIYGHNLNQGDIGVPGLIFVNKRAIFKTGRTWSELLNKDRSNPSSFSWISRYGSVTFNAFGRDFPDGGMNEAGLYIWEMNEAADYPKNDRLPKLNRMNWMQFVLDSYSTVDEAIRSASEVEIEGSRWHYFVGDAQGNCAAIAFIDGKVIVNRDDTMPVPGLFNMPYDKELEVLKYYKGFGGQYEPDLSDREVPRFVKTAAMVRDYNPAEDAVEHGFQMLQNLMVFDVPEWSIIFDAFRGDVHFRTRVNPEIKHFSMSEVDFSNDTDVMILNMDIAEGGDVSKKFHRYTNDKVRAFLKASIVPMLPRHFFTEGGLTVDEYLDRFSSHSDAAASEDKQFFAGTWTPRRGRVNKKLEVKVKLFARREAVFGKICLSQQGSKWYECDHLQLIGRELKFTFRTDDGVFNEGKGVIKGNRLVMEFFRREENLGSTTLSRSN